MKNLLLKMFKSRYFYYIIFSFLCFGLYFFDLQNKLSGMENVDKTSLIFKITPLLFSAIFVLLLVVFAFCIKKIQKYNDNNCHKFYFVLAFLLGIIYIVIAPAFTGSDEHSHFYRVYEITDGKLLTTIKDGQVGSELPSSLAKTFSNGYKDAPNKLLRYRHDLKMSKVSLDKKETDLYGSGSLYEYQGASLYSPLQYIPQIIGVSIGKIFNLGPFWLLMLGRLFGLICFVFITTYGIYLIPKGKTFFMILLLTPVVLTGACTISCDGFTYALIFLFIAYILNKIYQKQLLSVKDKVLLIFLTIMISVCKIVYLPFAVLLFFIPNKCYNNKKEKYIISFLAIILGVIISMIWLHFTGIIFDNYYVNSQSQKTYVFNHLFEYIFIVIRSYAVKFSDLIQNLCFGNNLYNGQLDVYSVFSLSFVALVFIALFNSPSKNKLANYQKVIIIFVSICVLGLIASALYLQVTSQWVEVGHSTVAGMQGRYFIPIIMLLVLLIDRKKKFIDDKILLELFIVLQLPVFLTLVVQFI